MARIAPLSQYIQGALNQGIGMDWPDFFLPQRNPQLTFFTEPGRPPYDPEKDEPTSFQDKVVVPGKPIQAPAAFSQNINPASQMNLPPAIGPNISDILFQQGRQGALLAEGLPDLAQYDPGYAAGTIEDAPRWTPVIPQEQGGQSGQQAVGTQAIGQQPQRPFFRTQDEIPIQENQELMRQPPIQAQKKGLSDAAMWGLLSAGLGILQNNYGKYGQAGPAIGAGGTQGLNTFLGLRQQDVENQRRDMLAQQQGEYQRGQIEYQKSLAGAAAAKQKREEDEITQRKDIIDKLQKTTDPILIKKLTRDLALLEGKASDVYKADAKRNLKMVTEGVPGNDALEVPTLLDMDTQERLWTGEPRKKGALIGAVNIQDKKMTESYGTEIGKQLAQRQQSASQALDYADQVGVIEQALIDYEGGLPSAAMAKIGQLFPGGELGPIASANDLASSIATKLAPRLRVPGSGATTDYEMRLYLAAIPSMMTTRAGRRLMVEYAKRIAEREAEAADIWGELASSGERVSMKEYRARVKALGPLFQEGEIQALKNYKPGQEEQKVDSPPWKDK